MRALTIRQPFAGAVALGWKPVENRKQSWSHRGLLAIHAGLKMEGPEAFAKVERLSGRPVPMLGAPATPLVWTFGAIIGVVDLTGSHRSGECGAADGRGCSPWAEPYCTHLQLENARALRIPVRCHGKQGLWIPDEQTQAAVRRQIA